MQTVSCQPRNHAKGDWVGRTPFPIESAESDDDEEFTIHTEDVVRHVWRGVNIKYVVMHDGQRLFLTADQLDARFFGAKSALWGYWKTKSAKRMPQAKLIGHLKRYGIAGFFSEMLWHLLPDVIHFQLITLRRKNKLDDWKW